MPIATQIQRLINVSSIIKRKDVGALSSLIPGTGSRIALHQDKQLEIAHAEKY